MGENGSKNSLVSERDKFVLDSLMKRFTNRSDIMKLTNFDQAS